MSQQRSCRGTCALTTWLGLLFLRVSHIWKLEELDYQFIKLLWIVPWPIFRDTTYFQKLCQYQWRLITISTRKEGQSNIDHIGSKIFPWKSINSNSPQLSMYICYSLLRLLKTLHNKTISVFYTYIYCIYVCVDIYIYIWIYKRSIQREYSYISSAHHNKTKHTLRSLSK